MIVAVLDFVQSIVRQCTEHITVLVRSVHERKFTPLGVITGASRPRGSPGLLS